MIGTAHKLCHNIKAAVDTQCFGVKPVRLKHFVSTHEFMVYGKFNVCISNVSSYTTIANGLYTNPEHDANTHGWVVLIQMLHASNNRAGQPLTDRVSSIPNYLLCASHNTPC